MSYKKSMDIQENPKNKFIFEKPSFLVKSDNSDKILNIKEDEEVITKSTKPNIVKNKKRCSHPDCKKKLKLTDILCDCRNRYCSAHRLPHSHGCSYLSIKQTIHKKNISNNRCVKDKVIKF